MGAGGSKIRCRSKFAWVYIFLHDNMQRVYLAFFKIRRNNCYDDDTANFRGVVTAVRKKGAVLDPRSVGCCDYLSVRENLVLVYAIHNVKSVQVPRQARAALTGGSMTATRVKSVVQ